MNEEQKDNGVGAEDGEGGLDTPGAAEHSTGETGDHSVNEPEASVDPVLDINDAEWLDSPHRRHRSHRPEPKGPIQKLRRKWRRWRRKRRRLAKTAHWYRPRNVLAGIAAFIVLILVSAVIAAYATVGGIRRAPLLPLTASPPSVGTNLLLIGSDSGTGALNPDHSTLMVQFVHISANKQAAQIIDLPRDLVIGTGPTATTIAKVAAADGVTGIVATLQNAMNLTINHAIQTSFTGYTLVTDDLGGLTLPTASGNRHFTGAQAEAYVKAVPAADGSIETGHRFQFWSKALLEATLQPDVLANPFKDWSILNHTADNIVVDDSFTTNELIGFVWSLRGLKPANMHFFTAPNKGYDTVQGQRVLLPESVYFDRLSTAIRTDNPATLGLFQ